MNDACAQLEGWLGDALAANVHGRLSHFIVDAHSPAIALFGPAHACCNEEGDWYGEHAGKWLVAASRAAARTGDAPLRARVLDVADYLVSVQQADGYLGTYAPDRRFSVLPTPPVTDSWDGAPSLRTWDVWTHAYLILGLLEVHRRFGDPRHLQAACRIGDLCWRVFVEAGADVTRLGNHHGMSATVLMDPAVELYFATGEARYLALAQRVLDCAEANPRLRLLSRAIEGVDAAEIGTGKAYQLLWNMVGLAKLHRATGAPAYLDAVQRVWSNVRAYHLGLGGGPFGGIGHRSREVFNPAGVFEPDAYVETCSTLAWIQLNRELLRITGQARHAEEIERAAYNDLLGAQSADGEDWCYYTFANGPRIHTTYWRCCKSSGAMALEELPWSACAVDADGDVDVHLVAPMRVRLDHPRAGRIELVVHGDYPLGGAVHVDVACERPAAFALRVRVPSWAEGATLSGPGATVPVQPGAYARIDCSGQTSSHRTLHLPIAPRVHFRAHVNVQESRAPGGALVRQRVLDRHWLAVTRGPLVYASGLIDGYKSGESLWMEGDRAGWVADAASDDGVPRVLLRPGRREGIALEPFALVGARADGAWRLVWFALAPGGAPDAGDQ